MFQKGHYSSFQNIFCIKIRLVKHSKHIREEKCFAPFKYTKCRRVKDRQLRRYGLITNETVKNSGVRSYTSFHNSCFATAYKRGLFIKDNQGKFSCPEDITKKVFPTKNLISN